MLYDYLREVLERLREYETEDADLIVLIWLIEDWLRNHSPNPRRDKGST